LYAWKKCPLCADPVYKTDIRRVKLIIPVDDELTFQLFVRNKANISVMIADHKETKIIGSRLPSVRSAAYNQSRIRVADELYITQLYNEDIEILKKDLQFKVSCAE